MNREDAAMWHWAYFMRPQGTDTRTGVNVGPGITWKSGFPDNPK